ncbi:MAG: hypothetical protein AB7S75_06100 [Desulfococcaceae bacterium]
MKTLHTDHCIDTVMLARYFGQSLSDEEKRELETHVSECEECLDLFAAAGEILSDEEPEAYEPASEAETLSVMKGLGLCKKSRKENRAAEFFRKIYQFLLHLLMPRQTATVRSSAPCSSGFSAHPGKQMVEKKFGTFRSVISCEKADGESAEIRVSLSAYSGKIIRISLESANKDRDSRPFKNGCEIFENVRFGNYRMIILPDTMQEHVISFNISKEGIYES